jgi:hypothetical protein
MTKTYTIAMWNDALVACIPDGQDVNSAVAAEAKKANIPEMTATKVVSGLTLTDTEEDGDDVIYSGVAMGWLSDEAGRTYKYAVLRA